MSAHQFLVGLVVFVVPRDETPSRSWFMCGSFWCGDKEVVDVLLCGDVKVGFSG